MNKLLYYLSVITISMALLLLMWFFYILFWPINIIKPNTQPYKILTPIVKRGDDVVYLVDACKYVPVNGLVTRTFVDGNSYPSTTSLNNIGTGCRKTNVNVPVPLYVMPGKYHLELDIIYTVNAFRTEHANFTTENFIVK